MVNAKASSSAVSTTSEYKDVRNRQHMADYTKHWNADSSKDSAEQQKSRVDNYTEVVTAYYNAGTELYEWGWGQNFHFARYYPGEAFYQAIARHEHYLSAHMQLKPGMRVLDVGCGVGGPAREIARFSGAHVTGVNINDYQISRARKYTQKAKLADQVDFVVCDFMHLTEKFGENSFDAVYAIEATVHAPTFEGVYEQIKKVLKPGGIFGCYEWVMTDRYDASNPQHKAVAHGIEIGDGIPEMRTLKQARDAMHNVGFEVLHDEDLAERPDEIRWYYPLEGDVRKVQTLWDVVMVARMTWLGKIFTQSVVWTVEKLGLMPKGTYQVGEALKLAADALVAGGQQKIFTPMQLFIARKPEHTNGY